MHQIPAIIAAANVPPATDSRWGWVSLILREFGRSQATGFILDATKWTLLGALLGAVIAVIACVLFSRLGWYDLRWRFARGLRWTAFTLTVILSAILFGFAGFWSGAIDGSTRVLSKSQLATEVFPQIADVIADGMAWVQVHANSAGSTNSADVSAKLEEFRAGKWELHAAQFLRQLDDLKEATITNTIARLEQSALERTPKLKGGLGEKLLHQLLTGLGRLLVAKKVSSELKSYGADRIYFAIREELKTEAARAADPDTITRGELSAFLIREGIVPGIMKPIRSTARAQQLPLVGIAIAIIIVPPVCLRLARSRFGGPAQTNLNPPLARRACP